MIQFLYLILKKCHLPFLFFSARLLGKVVSKSGGNQLTKVQKNWKKHFGNYRGIRWGYLVGTTAVMAAGLGLLSYFFPSQIMQFLVQDSAIDPNLVGIITVFEYLMGLFL